MNHPAHPVPVVVDLKGLQPASQSLPILGDHQEKLSAAIGHTDNLEIGDNLVVEGLFSGANATTEEVVTKLENGMKLQASVGILYQSQNVRAVRKGESVRVNNRDMDGPLLLIKKSRLHEVSVVPIGADQTTSVQLAASSFQEETPMPEGMKQWAADRGIALDGLSEDQLTKLTASFAAEQKPEPEVKLAAAGGDGEALGEGDLTKQLRAAAAAETERVDAIAKICASHGNPEIEADGETKSLKAAAIAQGWSAEETELRAYRAAAPKAPAAHVPQNTGASTEKLEASLALQNGSTRAWAEKSYDEQTLDWADKNRFSPTEIMRAGLMDAGHSGAWRLKGTELVNQYNLKVLRAAGPSTYTLPTVLGNVARKGLYDHFMQADVTFRQMCRLNTVDDTHTHTNPKLLVKGTINEMPKGSSFEQDEITEDSYTTSLTKAGSMFEVPIEDILNDDLGEWGSLPQQMAENAARYLQNEFTAFYEATDAGFYSATTPEFSLKTSNALSIDGITAAMNTWYKKLDKANRKLGNLPSFLVVHPERAVEARKLMNATEVNETTTTDAPSPGYNPHQGLFNILVDRWLTTAGTWFLMSGANTPEAPFVYTTHTSTPGGAPTLEQDDSDFTTLGLRWRMWFWYDFAKRAPEGILKCTE